MKTFRFFSAMAFTAALTSSHCQAMDKNDQIAMDEPSTCNHKKLDFTWSPEDRKKFNLTYNNVIGLNIDSLSSSKFDYTPVVSVIDNMKEHSKHISSTIAEICPKAKIKEVEFSNVVEKIKDIASCRSVDIINLSFGPAYLSEVFGYEKLFANYSTVLSEFIQNCAKNKFFNMNQEDKNKLKDYLDSCLENLERMIQSLESDQLLMNKYISLEQFSKDTYDFLNNDLKVDSKHTQGLKDFNRRIEAFELIPYMTQKCSTYQAILEAAKKGKIIVQAYGNEHNRISSHFENEYTSRLNALAKEINENPDIKGRLIIVGNSQYINAKEKLNLSSTRSSLNQPYVVTAPGTNITARVAETKYELKSGTSMAAPAIDGVIARLLGEFKAEYENAGIKDMASIRGIIADHVITQTRKTNFFTQQPLPDKFGQGVVNYGLAKQAIKCDLQLLDYENKLKGLYEVKLFSVNLQNELQHRNEARKLNEQVHKLEIKLMDIEQKHQILNELEKLEESRNELGIIYNALNKL